MPLSLPSQTVRAGAAVTSEWGAGLRGAVDTGLGCLGKAWPTGVLPAAGEGRHPQTCSTCLNRPPTIKLSQARSYLVFHPR